MPGSALEGAGNEAIAGVGCQNDDAGFRELAANRAHGVYAAHLGHLQIHQSDVRLKLTKAFEGFTPIRGRRDEFHIGLIWVWLF